MPNALEETPEPETEVPALGTESADTAESLEQHDLDTPEVEEEPIEGEEPEEPEEVPEVETDPVVLKAGGRLHTLAGAVIDRETGAMYVPKENVAELTQLAQRGMHYETTWPEQVRQYQTQLKVAEAKVGISEATARAYTAEMEKIFTDEASITAFLQNPQGNIDLIKAKVAAAQTAAENEAFRNGVNIHQSEDDTKSPDFTKRAAQALLDNFDALCDREDLAKMLPADAREAVWKVIAGRAPQYLMKADQDYPQDGIRKGQTVINLQMLAQDMQQLGGLRGTPQVPAPQAKKKAFNEGMKTAVKVRPPVASQGKKTVPQSTKPKSETEWKNRLLALAREA